MKKLLNLIAALAMIAPNARTDDSKTKRPSHSEPNYILRRQQAYQVQGVPTDRLIIGKRQIDIYRNGLMFEGDHVVGVSR